MRVRFSPSLVKIVRMPWRSCPAAAVMASSSRSPGMNAETERRTNAVRVARSRSHALVDIARRALRARLITLRIADCGLRIDCGLTPDCGLKPGGRLEHSIPNQSAIRNPQSAMSRSQKPFDQAAIDLHRGAGDV